MCWELKNLEELFVIQGEVWKELYERKWKSKNYRNYIPESRGLSDKSKVKGGKWYLWRDLETDQKNWMWIAHESTGRRSFEYHKCSMTKDSIYTQKSMYLNSYVVLGCFFVGSCKVLLSDRWFHLSMKDIISGVLWG